MTTKVKQNNYLNSTSRSRMFNLLQLSLKLTKVTCPLIMQVAVATGNIKMALILAMNRSNPLAYMNTGAPECKVTVEAMHNSVQGRDLECVIRQMHCVDRTKKVQNYRGPSNSTKHSSCLTMRLNNSQAQSGIDINN